MRFQLKSSEIKASTQPYPAPLLAMRPPIHGEMDSLVSSSDVEPRSKSGGPGHLVLGLIFIAAFMLGACGALLLEPSSKSRLRALTTPTAGVGVVGLPGNPRRYGQVPEKTIWFYWDKGFNPMPSRIVDLCIQSFCANNVDWNFEFVSDANLLDYVSPEMLPSAFWSWPKGANKKDIVMANLLALYGGVAADSTILNFKSLNVLWQKMLHQGADAVVYWYRLHEPWQFEDSAAAWFFMARRDTGIFRRYAQDIKGNFGDVLDISQAGGNPYLAFATGSMEPIMMEINLSLPLCKTDKTLDPKVKMKCATGATKYHTTSNGNLNNTKVVMFDPNDRRMGPQLNSCAKPLCINLAGKCPTPTVENSGELWQDYLDRKSDPLFTMIKLFGGGGEFAKQNPELLLSDKEDNILSKWFKEAGLRPDEPSRCKAKLATA